MWKYPMDSDTFCNEWPFSYTPGTHSRQHSNDFDSGGETFANDAISDWLFSNNTSMNTDFVNPNPPPFGDFGKLKPDVDVNWTEFFNQSPKTTSSFSFDSPSLPSPTSSNIQHSRCGCFHSSPPTETFQDIKWMEEIPQTISDQSSSGARSEVPQVAWGKLRSKRALPDVPAEEFDDEASSVATDSPPMMAQVPRKPCKQESQRSKPHRTHSKESFEFASKKRKGVSAGKSKPIITKRRTHNEIEREYRNRLNSHFTDLLSILPSEVLQANVGSDDVAIAGTEGKGASTSKKVCKGTVLELAMKHIRNLETENLRFEEKLKALGED